MKGERLDPVDVDQILQVTNSAGYAAIVRRIVDMRARMARDLEGDLDQPKTDRARGFLAGIDACLRVPDALQEAKGKKS